jgi:hypothetical protein
VFDAAAVGRFQLRVVDVANFDLARPEIDDASIFAHGFLPLV